jgi:signal transduction histidine kinase
MKQKLIGLSQRYVAALRKHLNLGTRASLEPALVLGRRSAALGFETIELARIHERALLTLELSGGNKEQIERAQGFFAKAVAPTGEAPRRTRTSKATLNRLNKLLSRCTMQLAATNRQLQGSIVERKLREEAFEKSGRRHDKCLAKSLRLQKHLRELTHRMLAAQEAERTKLSHELQDDIAQTLLGVNVRLFTLKQEGRSNTEGLKNEIANAQRLVVESAKSVRRFARELEIHQPAP